MLLIGVLQNIMWLFIWWGVIKNVHLLYRYCCNNSGSMYICQACCIYHFSRFYYLVKTVNITQDNLATGNLQWGFW